MEQSLYLVLSIAQHKSFAAAHKAPPYEFVPHSNHHLRGAKTSSRSDFIQLVGLHPSKTDFIAALPPPRSTCENAPFVQDDVILA